MPEQEPSPSGSSGEIARGRYRTPSLECDLVMKGGVTSGVIYPLAICRLAETYRLRDIGGASAGAIAAVAAGAAEYGRDLGGSRPKAGFEGLEGLPALLTEEVGHSGQSRLLSLFQAKAEAAGLFKILLIAIGPLVGWRKSVSIVATAVAAEPIEAVLALAAIICLVALAGFGSHGVGSGIMIGLGIVAFLVVGVLASIAHFAWTSLRALGPSAGYGMCAGYAKAAPEPALTPWLATVLDDLAGVEADKPITFGDLKRKGISLSLMTTDLTHGRPYRLPLADPELGTFFFKQADFERLFPERLVRVMVEGAQARLADHGSAEAETLSRLSATLTASGQSGYWPFPDADHLPLVVGARMSLSFPVLLEAVPLYAVDWTLKANREGTPTLERCWFSDGGICSNLPIHFFDSLLPNRPTFALDLKAPHLDHPVQTPPFAPGEGEDQNVWLPTNNTGGVAASWNRFDQGSPTLPVLSFLGTMIDTMQSWNDNLTMHYPGYRDRIVHISCTDAEGGLNLNMPKDVIERLSERGAAAGKAIRERFDPASGDGWKNHLWVRYRTLLSMLTDQERSLIGVSGQVRELFEAPPSYKFSGAAQAAAAAQVNEALLNLVKRLVAASPPLSEGAPKPRAVLKGRPQSC